MVSRNLLALVVIGTGLLASAVNVWASEKVGVAGSSTQFSSRVETKVASRPVTLRLTGTALRQKYWINVYSMASYVQEGIKVQTPAELAEADCVKQLHLVMERSVQGKDMAEAFRSSIRMNYPEPAFADEVNLLVRSLQNDAIGKGENVYLTHLPGVGLHINVSGKADFVIKNVRFSKAIWDIYLGKNNLGEAIKKGLVSRL